MPSTPAILRFVITFAAIFIVLTNISGLPLLQKILFIALTCACTEWLFFFIPYLKRGSKK